MVAEENEKINSRFVVDDICALERNPATGKIAAATGKHDDMIMAYLIGLYVFRNASNIEEWGLYRGMTVPTGVKDTTPEAIAAKINELAQMLPPEMRKFFVRENKDPVSEARKYYEEIDRQLQHQNATRESYNELCGVTDDDDAYGSTLNMGDPRYQQSIDDEIVNLNLYNKDANFDINDWI